MIYFSILTLSDAKLNGYELRKNDVKNGVPHGSILSPKQFLLFSLDLVIHIKLFLDADDIVVCRINGY